jgi:hypothetical protein
MGAPRVIPSDSILQNMVERGMTHQEIADEVSRESGRRVGRSTISAALSRAGLTDRVRYDSVIPWPRIKIEHNHHYALSMLRLKARIDAGQPVTEENLKRFESWERKLRDNDAVVVYRADSPDGFYYCPRRPEDGDGLASMEP